VIQTGPSDRQHILTYPINPDPKASGIFAKSKELRQALCYAIDRKALIDTVLDGYGWPAVGLIRYGCLGYAPYLAKYNYNITKAKELLAKAGYPNGFKTTLKVEAKAFREYAEDLAVLIKAQLAKVGIDATLEVMDVGTFQKFMFYQDYELLMGGFRGTTPDPWGILRARYHSTAAGPGAGFWNYGAIKDPRLDVLLDMLDRTGEWKVAKQLSDEIQKIVIEEAYECALLDQASLYATAPIVQGLKIHPTYGFYFGATIYKPNVGIDVFLKQAGAGGSISPTAQPITGSSVRLCAAIRRDLRYNVVRQPRME
jgi:ABC-type transport system substrate-binding protein